MYKVHVHVLYIHIQVHTYIDGCYICMHLYLNVFVPLHLSIRTKDLCETNYPIFALIDDANREK